MIYFSGQSTSPASADVKDIRGTAFPQGPTREAEHGSSVLTPSAAATTDTVSLSTGGSNSVTLPERIARLQQAIDTGSYVVSPQKLAQALVDNRALFSRS